MIGTSRWTAIAACLLVWGGCATHVGNPGSTDASGDVGLEDSGQGMDDTGMSDTNSGSDTSADVSFPDAGADAVDDTGLADAGPDADDAGDATDADTGNPTPMDIQPCDAADCWDTTLVAPICGTNAIDENFSTERYNVHDFEINLQSLGANRITLNRNEGAWTPTLLLRQDDGTMLFDGTIGLVDGDVEVLLVEETDTTVEIEVLTDVDRVASLFVTSAEVAASSFADAMPAEATYTLTQQVVCDDPPGVLAPEGALTGETTIDATDTIAVGPEWGDPIRVDAAQSEHIGFRLDFSPEGGAVDFELLMWDGTEAVSIGYTNAGPGLRVIAAYDPFGARTFWVRARGEVGTVDLSIARTPVAPGPECNADCARLLQLPEPVDANRQGFDMAPGNNYREQFARRELLMAIFHAGFRVADAGYGPFTVQDLSNWDGSRPPGHETHNDGFHADISLLRADGSMTWVDPGEEFGDVPMAYMLAGFFEAGPFDTGNPAEVILDSEFHDDVDAGGDILLGQGEITEQTRALMDSTRGLIYHYQGHADHIHVRIDR